MTFFFFWFMFVSASIHESHKIDIDCLGTTDFFSAMPNAVAIVEVEKSRGSVSGGAGRSATIN